MDSSVAKRRASAMVVRDGLVLLVRHVGESLWCLPGGHIEPGEGALEAAVREVREETALLATFADRLCDGDSVDGAQHLVSVMTVEGDLRLEPLELSGHLWWDGETSIEARSHVHAAVRASGMFGSAAFSRTAGA